MALGRALRRVLIIDSGRPCNKKAPHAHNLITWDNAAPSEIIAKAKEQVLNYSTVQFIYGTVSDVQKLEHGFEARTEKGESFSAKKILFATGVSDTMPDLEYFSDCWGVSILHCPYCHGYEVKGVKTAVLANGEEAFLVCMVLTHWTEEIILLTNGESSLSENQTLKLQEHGIKIIEHKVEAISHSAGQLEQIRFSNGEKLDISVMYAKLAFKQHSNAPEKLGCELTEEGYIKVDECKKTSIPGVYAAGDNTSKGRTLAQAIAAGNIAGMMINGELSLDSFK